MALSKRALETLIDLVEIKVSCLEVMDREDARELANLQHCLSELKTFYGGGDMAPSDLVAMEENGRRRPGRRRAAA